MLRRSTRCRCLCAPPARRAHWLSCRHVGEELLWEGLVPIPAVKEFTYRLAVRRGAAAALRWCCGPVATSSGAVLAWHGCMCMLCSLLFWIVLAAVLFWGNGLHSNGFAFNAFCACCSSQVVNEEFEVVKWASERHSVVLPDGLEEGAIGGQGWGGRRAQGGAAWASSPSLIGNCFAFHGPPHTCSAQPTATTASLYSAPQWSLAVDVDEVWTDEGHPSLVLARSAFARVVWRNRCTAAGGRVLRQAPLLNEVVVRFQVQ